MITNRIENWSILAMAALLFTCLGCMPGEEGDGESPSDAGDDGQDIAEAIDCRTDELAASPEECAARGCDSTYVFPVDEECERLDPPGRRLEICLPVADVSTATLVYVRQEEGEWRAYEMDHRHYPGFTACAFEDQWGAEGPPPICKVCSDAGKM